MKKNLKQKTLWILLTVLVVLLALFVLLKQVNTKNEKQKEEKKQNEVVHIFETKELERISYEDNDGKTMEFDKDGEKWNYTADPSIPLTASTMEAMETAFSDITAVKEIEDPDKLSDYGLEKPAFKLLLTEKDGKTNLLLIGDQSGDNYYVMMEEEEKIYTVSADLVSQMIWDLSSLAEKETFASVTEDNFIKETVTKADGTETVLDSEDEEQKDAVSAAAQGYSGFYFTDCADYHVTEESLANYGLEEKSRTKVVLTYSETDEEGEKTEKELTFYVGGKDSTGVYYYVQLDGSQMVNTVTIESVEAALGWK